MIDEQDELQQQQHWAALAEQLGLTSEVQPPAPPPKAAQPARVLPRQPEADAAPSASQPESAPQGPVRVRDEGSRGVTSEKEPPEQESVVKEAEREQRPRR